MPRTLLVILSFTMVAVVCRSTFGEDNPKDTVTEKLQGRWEIVSGVNQGRELTKQELTGTYVTVTTNSIVTYDSDQQQRFQAVFIVDETHEPVHITMTSVPDIASSDEQTLAKGSSAAVASGILRIESQNRWVLCYALPGADRPTKFESSKGSKVMLFTLEKKHTTE